MSKHRLTTTQVVYTALFVAINVAIARIFLIPVPMTHGNINLCDAGIFIAALLFGKKQGALIGALSGFLLDLISGYAQYMIFSLIVHGLEGFIAGWFCEKGSKTAKFTGMGIGLIVMVAGYFVTDSLLYTLTTGLIGIPTNLIQGLVGSIVAYPLYLAIKKYMPSVSHT